ncbi:MAG TPA: 3-deoxy-7-phosphoheptulonate synthase [Polyangiales bacterium]
MHPTKNLRIVDTTVLQSPDDIARDLPLSPRAAGVVQRARSEIEAALHGRDARKLAIVGPCSVHDPAAALEYASRFSALRSRLEDDLVLVMRVYFEKPRTTVGWKGLINDPHLDGSFDIPEGLRRARRLLCELAELEVATATELLDPITPQYLADLISWAAIGARTTESQTHREMASGLSMPVGFKNGTDGGLSVAVNAMVTASRPHRFLGLDGSGRVGVVHTAGNPHTHLVLRGGSSGPNYAASHVQRAAHALVQAKVNSAVMVDCSHDNSHKDHARQAEALAAVSEQIATGSGHVLGVMLESNLVAGRQELKPGTALRYGQSITDACIDFATTERLLERLARDVATGRASAKASAASAPACLSA